MNFIFSPRLISIAFVICFASLTNQDCGDKGQRPSKNQQTSNIQSNVPLSERTTTAPESYFGITIEDTDAPDSIVDTIKRIKEETHRKVAVRIVIDPERDVTDKRYKGKVEILKRECDMVMALIGDSHDVHKFKDAGAYRKRIKECYMALSQSVDVWEIGNEVNGVWAGWEEKEGTPDEKQPWNLRGANRKKKRELIGKQIKAAYDELLGLNTKVQLALTVYYSGDQEKDNPCWDGPEYVMSEWIQKYIKDSAMKNRLNYVFVSFYSDDCPVISKDTETGALQWAAIFNSLSETFQNADVGFGEFAPQCSTYEECQSKKDRLCPDCVNDQIKFIPKYYKDYDKKLKGAVRKYMGGYFYWYGLQDMIPSNTTAVDELIKALNAP